MIKRVCVLVKTFQFPSIPFKYKSVNSIENIFFFKKKKAYLHVGKSIIGPQQKQFEDTK